MKKKDQKPADDSLRSKYGRATIDAWAELLHVSYDELARHVDEVRNRDSAHPASRQTPQRSRAYSEEIAANMLAFLAKYQETYRVVDAADSIGVTARTIRLWRKSFALFDELCGDLQESMVDVAEDELFARAVTGIDTNVYYMGVVAGKEKKKSDDLLKFLLTNNRMKFKNKAEVAVTGAGGGPVSVDINPLREKLYERLLAKVMTKGD